MDMGDMDAAAALGSQSLPVGGTPLSGHRAVLVQGDQAAASLCPRR
jgi:hypothetical protein